MATATPAPGGTIDFGRAFTFVTEDPDWIRKILIGGAFTLASGLLVGIPFVLGYFARTLRNVADGSARPLPEWDDLGGLFNEGLRLAAVYLVYVVGGMIVAALPGCLLMFPAMLASSSRHGQGATAALAALGMVAFYGLMMLLALLQLVYLPAAMTRVALRGTIQEGFAWQPIVGFIRANVGNYLLALLMFLVAGFLSQFGLLLCCVGIFPATFWAYLVLASGLGQTVQLHPASLS